MSVCTVDDCERQVKGRGLCDMHYQRMRNTGTTDPPAIRGGIDSALAALADHPVTCVEWAGSRNKDGYGMHSVYIRSERRQVTRGAHRFIYEMLVGPVPVGLVLDHLCRNRACVNPAHLEPVTNAENLLRGMAARYGVDPRTHCSNGHLRTPANTCPTRPGLLGRCRPCNTDAQARWRARQLECAS